MFEQLINEAASRFNLPIASVTALVRALLALMTNERTGGPQGFVSLFQRAGLGEIFTSWLGGKEGKPITPSDLESVLGMPALNNLAASTGLSRTTVSSASAFLLPRLVERLSPGGSLPSGASLLSQLSSYLDRPDVSPPVQHVEHRQERRGWPGWVPWAAAALVALAALLWLRAPSGTLDPQLTLTTRDGKVTYSGLVRDDATRSSIVSALSAAFGEANISGDLRVDGNVKRAAWLPRLGELFATLKTSGADLSLNGDDVKVGGWLSAADRQAIDDKLRSIFGAGATIGSLVDPAIEAARAANDRALTALGAIGTTGVTTDALVQAMNLAIVNFATGSAEIAPESMEVLRQSAEALKRAPAGWKVEIGGHTDNTGDPALNLALSQTRAEAVKSALVAAGVPAGSLTTQGYGETRPRASNDTEFGRFQNRRIEYSVR
jgi:outer membrane protein OmpA-like peptidoglycan-associated protein